MKLIGVISTAALSLVLGIAAPAYAQQDQQQDQKDKPAQQKEKQVQPDQNKAQPNERQPQQKQNAQQEKAQQQKPTQHGEQPAKDAKPAQQNEHQAQQEKQNAQPQKAQQEKPAQRGEQHAKDAKPAQQNEHQAQQEKQNAQPQQGRNEQPKRTPEQQRVQQTAWTQHRSHNWQSDHRTWQQRGGYNGFRIPDERFRGYFGPDHGFRIYGLPFLVVGGYPRFQYSGYWFTLVDPWPEYWAANWYDTDDVYVAYVDNGYYMFNRRHPDVGIAISISL